MTLFENINMKKENKMARTTVSKKDAQLLIKLERDLRDRFVKVAAMNDMTASQLIRHFIRDYLKNNSQLELK